MKVTDKEMAVLEAIYNCEYNTDAGTEEMINSFCWTWAIDEGLGDEFKIPQVKAGVIASLLKKGMIDVDRCDDVEEGKFEDMICLKEEGYYHATLG